DKLPEKLSGGEKQRVAIARALAANSKIIVADEPTGNLDDKNSEEIYSIFDRLAKKDGKIVIIVSHDKDLAKKADYQYEMKDGKLNLL
ncbi:MAG: ATP-binding cassette domain-containing protein, partial [Anaerococcus prevotii]|nr:ATP-binding cassette domain-containing protein [Anaerococcus prevotii]